MVFITKYALTRGVLEKELIGGVDAKMITVRWMGGMNGFAYFHKPDWYLTREEAVERAETMRDNKIKQLKAQIEKLAKKEF